MTNVEEFRQQTRAWLEENCPDSMRLPVKSENDQCWGGRNCVFQNQDQQKWLERMAERGWTTPQWPAEYGGGGLSKAEAKILGEEMARITARRSLDSLELAQAKQFVDILPHMQLWQAVRTYYELDMRVRIESLDLAHGIYRVGGAAAANLNVGNSESEIALDRDFDHCKSVISGQNVG